VFHHAVFGTVAETERQIGRGARVRE
jgi:hypothetical protein